MGPPIVPLADHVYTDVLSAVLITIYNASWETMGGGEKYLCMLADTLSREPGTTAEETRKKYFRRMPPAFSGLLPRTSSVRQSAWWPIPPGPPGLWTELEDRHWIFPLTVLFNARYSCSTLC